jgi:hypothetical protein
MERLTWMPEENDPWARRHSLTRLSHPVRMDPPSTDAADDSFSFWLLFVGACFGLLGFAYLSTRESTLRLVRKLTRLPPRLRPPAQHSKH